LVLALAYICGSIVLRLVDNKASTIASDQNFGLGGVDEIFRLSVFEAAARFLIFGVLVWYLRSLTVGARQVAEVAATSETFS
jgi:hypothetical protein